jgi:hypothetical protein
MTQMPTVTTHARRESGDMPRVFSLTPVTAALTPAIALDYLRELSTDIRAAILLDARGDRLAGPAHLETAAQALLAAASPGPGCLEGATGVGHVFAARDERHQIVVAAGPHVLPGLARHDLRTVLGALGGEQPPSEPPAAAPRPAVEAVLDAAARPG